MASDRAKASEQEVSLHEGRGYYDSSKITKDEKREEFAGFVHRILGPDGNEWRWLAYSIYGHAAHGRTPDAAVENLRTGMEALAAALGLSYAEWHRLQKPDGSRFVRASELVPA
jgi:hypothetical protein